MSLTISPDLHAQITAHLESTFPNEGGGFLLGDINGADRTLREIRIEENTFDTEEQYHRYLMETGAFTKAEDYADDNGLTLIGYFHSHPDSPAIPSEYDRVHALPNFLYLIISVQSGSTAHSKLWLLTEDRSKFDPLALHITDA